MVIEVQGTALPPWLHAPLHQALQQQRGHALLVQGAAGVGTLPFLLTLAQAWLCEGGGPARPCGQCASCRLVRSRAHPDLRLLLPEALRASLDLDLGDDDTGDAPRSKKKPSRQIRIDEVRAAIDWAVNSSSRGRAKLLVLHPAEAMNLQAASALLKTLEEPPGQARLLLGTADAGQLLPTVRSRCQRLWLKPPGPEEGTAWLARQGIDGAPVLLAAAGGMPLEAVALAEAGVDAAAWTALPRAVAGGQAAAFAGWPLPRVIDALQKLCHDALVTAAGGSPRFFPHQALPDGARVDALNAWSRTLGRVARHDEHPWNEGLLVDALVAEGRASWQDATRGGPSPRVPLDTLGR